MLEQIYFTSKLFVKTFCWNC